MREDKSASNMRLTREPRFRAECAEFFHEQEDEQFSFLGPEAVIEALEDAAVKSGRTFNGEVCHVLSICFGHQQPTLDDPRSVSDWRAMMSQCNFLTDEKSNGSPWSIPFDKWTETRGSA